MLSLSVYSQQDTSKVILPTKTARLIYQDLLRYDGCREELSLVKLKLVNVENREIQKDTLISLLEKKDKNNQYIIGQKDSQLGQYRKLTSGLKKELKKTKLNTFLYKAGTLLGVLATSYLLIIK